MGLHWDFAFQAFHRLIPDNWKSPCTNVERRSLVRIRSSRFFRSDVIDSSMGEVVGSLPRETKLRKKKRRRKKEEKEKIGERENKEKTIEWEK